MKHILVYIFLLSGCSIVFSQNEKQIDSLLNVLKTNKDYISQVNTLNNICLAYNINNKTKLNTYNQKILDLAKKHNYEIGFGYYFLNYSRTSFTTENNKESLQFSKKAAAVFSKNKNTSNYLIAIIEIAKDYIALNDSQKSKLTLNQNLKLALNHKNNDIVLDFYRLLGDNYGYQDSIAKSLIHYKKAIPFLSQRKTEAKSRFFQRISDQYLKLNQNNKALFYIDLAIENREKNYQFLVKAKKALILNKLNRFNEALELSLKNYQTILAFKMTCEWQYNLLLYNIANAYFNLKKYELAMPFLNKVIDKKNAIQEYKIECFVILSNINLIFNKPKEAEFYSYKALIFHDSLYKKHGNSELYDNVTKISEVIGDYKKAIFFYKKQVDFSNKKNDQITNENNLLQQTDFDIALKDYNIKKLQEQKALDTIENLKQKNYIMLFGGLLAVALLSVLFFIRNNKTIKKKNIEIEKEKYLTQKSLTEKEILLKEIHHRVKNNMQMVISLLKIQSLDAKELTIEDFINVSEARINSMVLIHENLYQSDNLNKVDFKEYLNTLTQYITSCYQGFKNIKLEIEVNNIFFDVQTAIPIGLIVNELVNNAYKHAFTNKDKGLILIQIIQNQEQYTLIVCDDGSGIDDHKKSEKSLGLELVRLLVSQIKGVSQIDNTNGTSFTMKFQNVIL